MLYGCVNCKENSVVRKCYVRKSDGAYKRVEFCLNKGCGYSRDLTMPNYYRLRRLVGVATAAVLLILINTTAQAAVNLETIKQIESSGNPRAYNKTSHARGLYQITPIVLKDYNIYNKPRYNPADLFTPAVNLKIAGWYLNVRIPQMLRYYNKPICINNILIAYNAGINYVVKGKKLPAETINYINNYHERTK